MAVAVAVAQVCNVVATTTITLAGRLKLSFPSFSFMQLKRRWKVTLAFSFAGCEKIACNTFKKREYALKRKPFGDAHSLTQVTRSSLLLNRCLILKQVDYCL